MEKYFSKLQLLFILTLLALLAEIIKLQNVISPNRGKMVERVNTFEKGEKKWQIVIIANSDEWRLVQQQYYRLVQSNFSDRLFQFNLRFIPSEREKADL